MIDLSEEERDALQEIMNISMGQAANSLARLIQTKVALSVPAIRSMSPVDFQSAIKELTHCWFARQSFTGTIRGEVITSVQKEGCSALAQVMDFDLPLDQMATQELVLEVTNILSAACLQGLTSQLELSTQLNMPAFYYPEQMMHGSEWSSILIIEVDFCIEHMQFDARVLIGLSEGSIEQLLLPIRALLAD
jgi:chemotaxis protein CheC